MRRPPKSSVATQSAFLATGAQRNGAVILEAILVIPLLLILFFGIMEFGILMLVIAAATEATVDGAYTGALLYPASMPFDTAGPDPTPDDDISDAIALQMDRTLNAVSIEVRQNGVHDTAAFVNAYVRISRWNGTMVVTAERGNTTLSGDCPAAAPAPGPNECVVQLCFPLISGAPTGKPVPNLLSVFHFNLAGRFFNTTSRYQLQ